MMRNVSLVSERGSIEVSFWFELLRPHWLLLVIAFVLAIITSLLEGALAVLVLPLLQFLGGNSSVSLQSPKFLQSVTNFYNQFPNNWHLIAIATSVFIVNILKNSSSYLSNISINRLQLQFGNAIRERCIKRFLQLELLFYSQSKIGELLSYVNEHVQRSEGLASYLLEITSDALTILALLFVLISISPNLTLIAVVSLILIAFLMRPVIKSVQIYGRQAANAAESLTVVVTEIISGIRIIKAFNAETRELNRANQALKTRYDAELSAYKFKTAVVPLTETAGITVLLVLLVMGTSLLANSESTVLPSLLTYTLTLIRILPRVSHLNSMRSQVSFISGSLESIQKFLSTTATQHLPEGTEVYRGINLELVFKDVSFTFPGNMEPTLKIVNLKISKGKTTAIVGSSGSGKSTLADLVMRFHDPDTGSIYIDGTDLKQLQTSSWRRAIAMVSQDTFLFNTSVRENIAYGYAEATEAEIINAAKKAHAYEFIQELPEAFDTVVGNRGAKLSGGQRQRIAIARAILTSPDLLILDEATSALDNTSERIVQQAIEEVSCDRTVIIIAHRLTTIEKADNIIVLHNGSVVEQGSHEQLLIKNGEYASLYKSQSYFPDLADDKELNNLKL